MLDTVSIHKLMKSELLKQVGTVARLCVQSTPFNISESVRSNRGSINWIIILNIR